MARPQALVAASRSDTSIILTLDVSRSMCSTDVSPNRLAAAQEAAREFVDDQPGDTRLGIVVFAATAQVLVPPTTDRDRLHDAIDGLTTSIGTAIGNGLLSSIDALARVNVDIAPSTVRLTAERSARQPVRQQVRPRRRRAAHRRRGDDRGRSPSGGPSGSRSAHPRVHHRLRDAPSRARWCARRSSSAARTSAHPRAGFPHPTSICRSATISSRSTRRRCDRSRGRPAAPTARAASADQLEQVFANLPRRVVTVKEVHELTVFLVGLGALLAVGAVATSRWWNRFS